MKSIFPGGALDLKYSLDAFGKCAWFRDSFVLLGKYGKIPKDKKKTMYSIYSQGLQISNFTCGTYFSISQYVIEHSRSFVYFAN